jgi:glyoxylase-like metal-dependent hydrolase (beta-lactamase superfamily II)
MPRLLVPLLLLLSAPALAQEDRFAKVQVTATHVAGPVHMLQGAGGNIGVSAGPDGLLLVDDQFAPLAPKIRAALAKLKKGKVDFVLNTHWHGDHTGSNAAFGKEARVVAHAHVRARLQKGQSIRGQAIPPAPREALPVITYEQGLSLHFNGEEIRVTHLPTGHTDGDSVVHFTGSKVLHLGDQFFVGRFPFVDFESGGDVEGYLRNVGQVLATLPPDTRIIPGHGPLAGRAELEAFHQMLQQTVQHVRERRAAGKTLAQVQEEGLPEQWKSWGEGYVKTPQWLEAVYTSLERNAAKG